VSHTGNSATSTGGWCGGSACPGAIGAFAGATFLSRASTAAAAPLTSLILLALGAYILVRFTVFGLPRARLGRPLRARFLAPLGLVGGFVDASGGGGWGPVGTPAILSSGRLEPRKVVGSINTSEFLVSVAASAGFLIGLGTESIDLVWVALLLLGGVIAAPIAAWTVRHVPPRLAGTAVGGLIILTNTRTLLRSDWIEATDAVRHSVYAAIAVGWAVAFAYTLRQYRRHRDEDRRTPAETATRGPDRTAGGRTAPRPATRATSPAG
jgi:uncharacterized membrane protein YfcA